jgi:peptide-methionine (R)-S-oxide reductase
MERRTWLVGTAIGLAASLLRLPHAEAERFSVTHTDDEWHHLLTQAQYDVLRRESTEPPFTSQLLHEHRPGFFTCAACNEFLFKSETKFDSGTGWPSFWAPVGKAVAERTDWSLGIPRTEVHCAKCGGHLGHVFKDGPQPTGLRYCMNGVAMGFRPAS